MKNRFFYSGTSGLLLNIPKYQFPETFQHASRLTYYSHLFNSIEINSSFYKIPQPVTVAKWAASVQEGFRFTFKLWKEITHSKNIKLNEAELNLFFEAINQVNDKKGALLVQFPPGIGVDYFPKLETILFQLQGFNAEWKIAVEFRNKSWYKNSTYKLLNNFKAALVIQDIPKSATPMINHESDFIYIRFHGPTGNYRDSYSPDFLHEYAGYVLEWIEQGKVVFVYFNNTVGDAFNNLETLNSFLNNK